MDNEDLGAYMTDEKLTKEEFSAICADCGLEVETAECGPGMIDVVAYISSPRAEGRQDLVLLVEQLRTVRKVSIPWIL